MKKIALLLLIAVLSGCYARDPEKTGHEGKPVPSFLLRLPDSTTYFNTDNIPAGKPFVLFYFGTYCPYSREEMEEVIEDMDILKDIHIYAITTSPFNEMKDFIAQYQLQKYPNITVGADDTNFFADHFEVVGVPYMAIYGKDKKLNAAFMGKVYGKQIRKIADK